MSNEYENLNEEEEKKKKGIVFFLGKREKIFLIIIALITVAAIGVTIWALFFRKPDDSGLTPDYAPQETEDNAEPMPDNGNDKLESPDGGGAVALSYTKNVAIDISSEKAVLNFGNPQESNKDMLVQIVIQDTILVQSGRLTPGHKVTQLDLLEGAAKKLQPGGYEGKIVVLFYDQKSGEKAMLNAEIPVTIQVQK